MTFETNFKPSRVTTACRRCGKPCDSKWSRKYCSRACSDAERSERAAARRDERQRRHTCPVCGKPPSVDARGRVRSTKGCCSVACMVKLMRKRAAERPERAERACPRCGVSFIPRHMGRGWQKFCSATCAKQRTFETRECAQCGCAVRKLKSQTRRSSKVFCSKACQHKHHQGANHPQFRAEALLDPKRRGTTGEWKRLSAEIRRRDAHTCRRCGAVRRPHERQYPVDHIRPWRTFAEKAEANAASNLATLCHTCHTVKTTTIEAAYLRGDMQLFAKYLVDIRAEELVQP